MTNTYLIAHGSKAVQAARIIAAVNNQPRPTVAPQQCGGDHEKLLMEIAILMHNWRCGRYKSDYVMSRLSQMFPSTPSAAARNNKP